MAMAAKIRIASGEKGSGIRVSSMGVKIGAKGAPGGPTSQPGGQVARPSPRPSCRVLVIPEASGALIFYIIFRDLLGTLIIGKT